MALVADIYGLSPAEAMSLTDQETAFLLDKAQTTMLTLATTSPAMQELLRAQLAPTLRTVLEAPRQAGGADGPAGARPAG